jgi:hypothetical protein
MPTDKIFAPAGIPTGVVNPNEHFWDSMAAREANRIAVAVLLSEVAACAVTAPPVRVATEPSVEEVGRSVKTVSATYPPPLYSVW